MKYLIIFIILIFLFTSCDQLTSWEEPIYVDKAYVNQRYSYNNEEWVLEGVFARLSYNTNLATNSTTERNMKFNVAQNDDFNMMDSTNQDRINIPYDGTYLIVGKIAWGLSSTGIRLVSIKKNNVTGLAQVIIPAHAIMGASVEIVTVAYLEKGDYFTVGTYQNCGAPLDLIGNSVTAPLICVYRLN